MKRILFFFALAFTYISIHGQCFSITTISSGQYHNLALTEDGKLYGWGVNFMTIYDFPYQGLLGIGSSPAFVSNPIQIGTDTWKTVSAGSVHSLAIKSDGTLWAWGRNSEGQLGDGTTVAKSIPVLISSDNWKAISAGGNHSLAIKSDGTLWAWGSNWTGQVGIGTEGTFQLLPVKISTDTWKAISAGDNHSLAIKSDGTLWAWGWNGMGQIGDGTSQDNRDTPKKIGTDTWSSIEAGSYHNLAIKTDGTLWAWGDNSVGQVGQTTNIRTTPWQVPVDGVKIAAAGASSSYVVKNDGTLWAWGANDRGNLGDGTTINTNVPKQIGTNRWSLISPGGNGWNFVIGKTSDGAIMVWGYNEYGQLGDGTLNDRHSPSFTMISPYSLTLAQGGSSHTITATPSHAVFTNGCQPIAAIQQPISSADGISSSVTAKVWVNTIPPPNYVKRHYEITPAANAATATAWVTLYFAQEDFDDFNNVNALKLPIGPIDTEGNKANLLIEKRGGESTDNSGLPGTYPGAIQTINPDDDNIVWNTAASRWEVTFEVTGFSGFFVKTQDQALPVTFGDISAIIRGGSLFVNFTSLTEENNDRFIIEASADGKNFTAIGTLKSTAKEGNSDIAIQYSFSLNANSLGIAGMAGFGLFALLCFASRRNRGVFAVAAIICAASFISCNRNVEELSVNSGENVYIRIAQVDKDGTKTYSKVVKAVKE